MTEHSTLDVDLDKEQVRFEGEWVSRGDLAERIKRMIEQQDFKISAAGNALEFLEKALASVQRLEVRLLGADAERLDRHAEKAGISAPAFVRQALMAYLAAQPPLDQAPDTAPKINPALAPVPLGPAETMPGDPVQAQVLTTVTTEPASPEEEGQAVELTDRKSGNGSKVVVDPSLQAEPPSQNSIGDSWFKKS